MTFTIVNKVNSKRAPSNFSISNPKKTQLFDSAWIPIHKFEATIPIAAKLPDFLKMAKP